MRPSAASLLKRSKRKTLLVSNPVNIQYLTQIPLEGALLLVSDGKYRAFVDDLEIEMARAATKKSVRILPLAELETAFKKIRSCGYEAEYVTIGRLGRWQRLFKNTKFVQTVDIVEEFRRAKGVDELKKILRAKRITAQVLKKIPKVLKPGITEERLAHLIELWTKELGAEGMSFETIVAFGTNTSRPHHRPTDRRLRKGDIVQIDMGALYQRYCGDMSRVYFTATPTREQKKVFDAVAKAKRMATAAVKKGASSRMLDRIARDVLANENLDRYFTHTLGHGVGLEIHEGVRLSVRAPDVRLLAGEVITIEPGVYIPGKFGIRLEDMIVVDS